MLSTASLTIQNTILYYDLLRHAHRTCTKISKNTKAFAISSQKLNHFFKAYLAFLKMDPVGCSLALSCNPPCWFSLRFLPLNQDGISSKDPANSRLTICIPNNSQPQPATSQGDGFELWGALQQRCDSSASVGIADHFVKWPPLPWFPATFHFHLPLNVCASCCIDRIYLNLR